MAVMDPLDVLDDDRSNLLVGVENELEELAVGDGVLERVGFVPTLGVSTPR